MSRADVEADHPGHDIRSVTIAAGPVTAVAWYCHDCHPEYAAMLMNAKLEGARNG